MLSAATVKILTEMNRGLQLRNLRIAEGD